MDSFNFCNVTVEKANAMKKHRQLRKIANLFRVVEVCIVLVLFSRFTVQLPVAVKNSGWYFKDLTVILSSPRFVFAIGNVIVVTLFAKSGQFSGKDSRERSSKSDLYEEFVEKSQGRQRYEFSVLESSCSAPGIRNYQRSRSENFQRPKSNKPCKELRRAVTETFRRSVDSQVEKSYPEDNMSNEEFRSTVEAFIARQKRLRIHEEKSVF
ncbi:hypothetical protein K2173_013578 [Erythroxylum novogranatense]|uniref:DUF4408 domain-containing protein n=1 Tax=Erythroxylum novogranatense TaxID=1862640 RepID=A0AAV8TJX4_9ROSI|nr:hypothetical protein K2173_013578 [Erythroxylum novogranatense]